MDNPVRILLVEDEFITLETLSAVLTEMKYEISGDAMNASDAIKILEKGETDLAILDINIQGEKDGIWLAEQIRDKYNIPFIFLTGFGDKGTVQRAIETEPFGYLIKPFNKVDIFAAIEVALKSFAKLAHSTTEAEPVDTEDSSDFILARDSIFVRDHYMFIKLKIEHILYLKSDKNYIEVHLAEKKHLIRGKLGDFMDNLPKDKFIQVHRSYVVNIESVESFGGGFLFVNSVEIPMGTGYREELKRRITLF